MRPRQYYLYNFVVLLALVISPSKRPLSLPIDIGEELPFETVAFGKNAFPSPGFPWHAPGVYFLWERGDIAAIVSWITPKTLDRLKEIDFSKHAIIAVFHGFRTDTDYSVVIEHYGIREDHIVLLTRFEENGPDCAWHPAHSSPYYLIRVAKDERLTSKSSIEMHSYVRYYTC